MDNIITILFIGILFIIFYTISNYLYHKNDEEYSPKWLIIAVICLFVGAFLISTFIWLFSKGLW